ncbi:SDR family oxidoreductase [Jiella mangrovi]|uniref:SDR family oxidoreductase n=1 Tax=Jiella mangrovi TaxID=2821407 RepID=A0ABS4BJ09_9HYPH|nr:SDR family oxidoreductase [Jiella mangrovi]MBP0616754.1 SDR family oxidoreductase [Jiella mangrovi]
MTLAITGVTGQLGRLVVAALKKNGVSEPIVGIARSPEKAADLPVEVRAGDYGDKEALEAALAGVDTLLLISSSEVGSRVAQHRNVIEAAKAAGVKRIAYTSILHADTSPLGLAEEHRATEALIRESGMAYTLLRNGWYTENYAASIPGALQAGAFVGSAGEGRIASAARADYAEAAAAVLAGPGHDDAVYELAGEGAYTLSEFAAEISRRAGREIPYRDLPQADYAALLVSVGLPEPLAAMLADSDAGAAKGGLYGNEPDLARLIGRPTTPMAKVVEAAMA